MYRVFNNEYNTNMLMKLSNKVMLLDKKALVESNDSTFTLIYV
jgi:hypothetical protein